MAKKQAEETIQKWYFILQSAVRRSDTTLNLLNSNYGGPVRSSNSHVVVRNEVLKVKSGKVVFVYNLQIKVKLKL